MLPMVGIGRGSAAHPGLHEVLSRWASAAWRCGWRMTIIAPAPVPEKLAGANERTTLLRPDRDRGGRGECRGHRRGGRRRLPLGRAFRSQRLARHSRRVRQSEIPQGDRPGHCRRHEARQGAGPAGADNRAGHRASPARLRFHLLFRRRLGAAATRSTEAIAKLAPPPRRRAERWPGAVPRRAVGRFQEGRRLADLPGFRPLAAAQSSPASRCEYLERGDGSARPTSSTISTRSSC